jgi:TolB-like protein
MRSSLSTEKMSLPMGDTLWGQRGAPLARSSDRFPAVDLWRHKTIDPRTIPAPRAETGSDPEIVLNGAAGCLPLNSVVLQQLDRIVQSKTFVQSEKLSRFLRFVVEHVLVGNPACLKEYLVGVEVYDRKPPYDPSQDSIVRTEARRLRNKLKEYYGAEGKEDPVYIYLRPGSYVPVFQSREDLADAPSSIEPDTILARESSAVVIAILPFTDISGNCKSAIYARGIPDELAYVLMRNKRCKVLPLFSTACVASHGLDVTATIKNLGAQMAFEGSARVEGTRLRVTARIVDATGVPLWIKRIDTEIETETSFAIEENIASALSAGFDVVRTPGFAPSADTHC